MKKILFAIGILIVIGGGVAFYLYNMPHQNIKRATPDYEMTALELFRAFEEDEGTANEKYLDKIIKVAGMVQGMEKNDEGIVSVTLQGDGMFGVICQLDQLSEHPRTEFEAGERVTFKGKCTGMLMDVVLVRCVEVEE
jgi:hypothetical protein